MRGPERVRRDTEAIDFVELLRRHAADRPDHTSFHFVDEASLTYRELDTAARAVAANLQAGEVEPGDRVLLLHPPGSGYLAGFFGCLYAGAVAVPVYPPTNRRSLDRVLAVAADAGARVALTDSQSIEAVRSRTSTVTAIRSLRWQLTDEPGDPSHWTEPSISSGTQAFIQYTSGSTAAPKGVLLSHGNLVHNSSVIARALQADRNSRAVSWLPPYHDMGLIGGILQPLYSGFPCLLMSSLTFLHQPVRWLRAISEFGATSSAAPDFAYAECVNRITDEELATLDLSTWRHALVGAEPVRARTLDAFTERFARAGFRRQAFLPCYGLAEATLFVTGIDAATAPNELRVDRDALSRDEIEPAEGPRSTILIGCGGTVGADRYAVVDPLTQREQPVGAVGEIWVCGPTVSQGYWAKPEETERTFRARLFSDRENYWLRTGDLGFQHNNDLFVVGRLDDLIVVRGANHHPQDIELTVEGTNEILRRSAAFAVDDDGQAQVVVVSEVVRGLENSDPAKVIHAIREAVTEAHGLNLRDVVLVRAGSVPRTSSGKVRRSACRELYLTGGLRVVAADRTELEAVPDSSSSTNSSDDTVTALVAAALECASADIAPDRPLAGQGLDSLRAARLRAALLTERGIEVDLEWLLSTATPAQLTTGGRSVDRPSPIPELPTDTPLPASFGQHRLWLLDQLGAGAAYHITGRARWDNAPDVAVLRAALNLLVERHEILRTGFRLADDGTLEQVVHAPGPIELAGRQVRDNAELDAASVDLTRQPFDLTRPPLLRAELIQVIDSGEWVLVLCVHHIVVDGWSLGVLTRELSMGYAALSDGRRIELPPLPARYAEFANWQREQLAGRSGAEHVRYWRERLAGVIELELPTDRIRPTARSFNGGTIPIELRPELVTRLRELAAEQRATLFMVLAATWSVVLGRWSGQTDVLLGTLLAGRTRTELADLVGFFVNTVPLRVQVSGDFRELLDSVRRNCLSAAEHQELPYEQIVRAARSERHDAGHSELVRHIVVLHNTPRTGAERLDTELLSLDAGTAQFDLELELAPAHNGGLSGRVRFSSDLFEPRSVRRLVAGLEQVIQAVVADSSCPVRELPVMSDADTKYVTRTLSESAAPGDGTFPDVVRWFESVADNHVNQLAVVADSGGSLTFGELEKRANAVAHGLRARGIDVEDRVGICVERGVDLVVAVLGVSKAGAAFVPLDPEYPRGRLEMIATDAALSLILATDSVRRVLPSTSVPIVSVHELDGKHDRPKVPLDPANAAYVLFTSGSTGRPKGAVNTHRGLLNRLLWMKNRFELRPGEAVLQKTSIGFDVSVWELFWPLVVGGRMVLAVPGGHRDPAYLHELIDRRSVVCCHFVPSMLRAFVDATPAECGHPTLRWVQCSGEELPVALADDFLRAFPEVELHNLYGPTEAAIDVTAHAVRSMRSKVSIGTPVPGTQLYVLDDRMRPLPIGVPGELFIGGIQLARGYHGRSGLTAERFVPHPYRSGERLYATGDRVRWFADGTLEFLGRLDDQVKIRGHRVEPREVEVVLRAHPAVAEAVVVARSRPPRHELVLAGYLVANGERPDPREFQAYLEGRLPGYMVPVFLGWLDALPLLPNGKVNRKALPALEIGGSAAQYVAPNGPLERQIADIWSEVLGIERIGAQDSFFDLGGHSLLATRVVSRIRTQLGVDLPVTDLLTARPTVEQVAKLVERRRLEQAPPNRLRSMVAWLSELSDEEARALLAAEDAPGNDPPDHRW